MKLHKIKLNPKKFFDLKVSKNLGIMIAVRCIYIFVLCNIFYLWFIPQWALKNNVGITTPNIVAILACFIVLAIFHLTEKAIASALLRFFKNVPKVYIIGLNRGYGRLFDVSWYVFVSLLAWIFIYLSLKVEYYNPGSIFGVIGIFSVLLSIYMISNVLGQALILKYKVKKQKN